MPLWAVGNTCHIRVVKDAQQVVGDMPGDISDMYFDI